MKAAIILESTIPLICKTQEEFLQLINEGYVMKEVKNIKYLIRYEVL